MGAGIGVPLGVAALGLLGFLFWREARRNSIRKPQVLKVGDGSSRDEASAEADGQARIGELSDSQRPWEADPSAVKVELPGSQTEPR